MPRSRMIDNFSLLAHAHKVGFYHQPGTRKSGYAKCDENSLRVLNNTRRMKSAGKITGMITSMITIMITITTGKIY